jgi:hypothetical protein
MAGAERQPGRHWRLLMSAWRPSRTARRQAEGVAITMPLRSEDWGERAFQVRDPNGVIVELLDWNAAPRA